MLIPKDLPRQRRGLLLLIFLAAAVAFWLHLRAEEGNRARVYYKGEQVLEFKLEDYADPVIVHMQELGYDAPVSFEIKEHRIRFVDVDCPDKLCEGFGFIGDRRESAVCMPNGVSVAIV